MAKNDKKDEGEEYEFSIPDFDEDAFIHKELISFRTTSILFVWGILSALVSWGLFEALDGAKTAWYLGIAIMAAFAYLLRYLYPRLNIDISHFGRREWFGTFFLLFFAWLAFFILFINPPISDHADPTVNFFASPSVQQLGGDVHLDLFAADNGRLDGIEFSLGKGTQELADQDDLINNGGGHWNYTLVAPTAGQYAYSFQAIDAKGNVATVGGTFLVKSQALRVEMPTGNRLDEAGDQVVVTVDGLGPCNSKEARDGGECLRTVYFDLDNGNQIHLLYQPDFNAWIARASFAGWDSGVNEFSVVAEHVNRFQGAHIIDGGELVLAGPFNLTVDAIVGEYMADHPEEALSPPITRRTPGFGGLAGIAMLAGAAVMWRRQE